MARTKQTPRWGAGQGRMPKAMFATPPDTDTPSTSGSLAPAAATSTSTDDRVKCPRSRAPRAPKHQHVPAHAGHVPPALQIARENATARITSANATPQGYYKPSDKQNNSKWKPGTQSL